MKKCAVARRKDAVIPAFDQISALILMFTALLNNDRIISSKCISCWSLEKLLFVEVFAIFHPFLEVIHGILHYQLRRTAHWWLQWKWLILYAWKILYCSSMVGWWYFVLFLVIVMKVPGSSCSGTVSFHVFLCCVTYFKFLCLFCFFKLVANFPFNILPHCFWPSWTKHLLEFSSLL